MTDRQVKLPVPGVELADQDLPVLFGMMIFGEARGELYGAKVGVGSVAMNRATHPRWWGRDLRSVVLSPFQFSCFDTSDPNYRKLFSPLRFEEPEIWDTCYLVAEDILRGNLLDITASADHYLDQSLFDKKKVPKWADPKKLTVQIGRLYFYRLYI